MNNLSKINVCIISSSFPPIKDGVGDYTDILIKCLIKNEKFCFFLITSQAVGKINQKHITTLSVISKWSARSMLSLLKHIRSIRPSVIHLQYPCKDYHRYLMINVFPLFCRIFFRKVIFITTLHEFAAYGQLGKIRTYLLTLFSHQCIVVEKQAIQMLSQFCQPLKKYIIGKTHYIPIASNINPIIKTESTANTTVKSIGYFGFVRSDKGLENLIKAYDILINHLYYENIHLYLLCELDPKDIYQNSILDYIATHNLRQHITITGYLSEQELQLKLSEMSLCVFPFKNGFTDKRGSVFAAMSLKIPIITTVSPFIPEGLSHNDNIYLIQRADPELISDAIIQLLQNSNLRNHIAHQAFIWLTMNRSWATIADRHIQLYSNLLE